MTKVVDSFVALFEVRGASAIQQLQTLSTQAKSASRQLSATGKSASSSVAGVARLGGALQSASGGAKGLASGLAGAAGAGGALGAAAAAAVGLGAGIFDAANAASALNEQVNGVGVTFGQAAGQVRSFAKTTADGLGISETAALRASAGFGQFFKQAGFADEETARFSTTLVQLAGDLASFRDVSVDQSLGAIASGLAGESEPLRRLGIDLRITRVEATALNLGFAKTASTLSETAKTAARYVELLRQSRDAQGDAARTSDSFANAQRRLNASFEELKTSAGGAASGPLAAAFEGLNAIIRLGSDFENQKKKFSLKNVLQLDAKDFAGGALNVIGKSFKDNGDRVQAAARVYDTAISKYGEGSVQASGAQRELAAAVSAAEKEQVRQNRATETGAQTVARLRQETEAAIGTIKGVVQAQRGAEDAINRVGDSQRSLADAQRSLSELQKKGKVDAEALADAEDRLADATQRVADAEQSAIDARRSLNELLRKGKVDVDEVARAERDLATARRTEKDAVADLAEAEAELARIRNGPTARETSTADRDVKRAQIGVEEANARRADILNRLNRARGADRIELQRELASAELDVADATERLSDAEKAALDLKNRNAAGSKDLATAERNVEDARLNADDAARARREAEEADRKARQGDPDYEEKVAAKKRDVAAADRDVVSARKDRNKADSDARRERAGDPQFESNLADAKERVRDAQLGVNRAIQDLPGAIEGSKSALAELRDLLAAGDEKARSLAAALGLLGLGGLAPSGSSGNPGIGTIRPRANGGPVSAGTSYLVGERGPEFFTPNSSGRINPTASSSGGGTQVIQLALDGRVVAEIVTAHQRRFSQQGGTR